MELLKKILALIIGCFVAILILEIFLKIYQPFPVSIRNNELILRANTTLKYENPPDFGLDSIAINNLNSMGFRGEEMPENIEDYLSIITVGGSTTVCRNLDKGKDWPHLLKEKLTQNTNKKIWLNNAGLNGNSTFGHLFLLRTQIVEIAPDIIFYLVGINDVERADLHEADLRWRADKIYSIKDWLKKNSETALLFETLHRQYFGYQINMNEEMTSLKKPNFVNISDKEISQFVDNQSRFLMQYENPAISTVKCLRKKIIESIVNYSKKSHF